MWFNLVFVKVDKKQQQLSSIIYSIFSLFIVYRKQDLAHLRA